MASFDSHLAVGIAVSGAFASGTLVLGIAQSTVVISLFLIGTLGSLLPDIDADDASPLKAAFSLLSILIAFLVMFAASLLFSTLAELLLIWVASFLLIRWGVFHLFTRYTTHRGIIHSVPMALLAASLTVTLAHSLLAQPPELAWLGGGFMLLGYLTHLLLDEMSALNLFGVRSKRSFGSALKFWYGKSWVASLAAYLLLALSLVALPPIEPLWSEWMEEGSTLSTGNLLWPQEGWFRL